MESERQGEKTRKHMIRYKTKGQKSHLIVNTELTICRLPVDNLIRSQRYFLRIDHFVG